MMHALLTLARFLNRVAGVVAGLLLYPLKSLFINLLLGLAAFPLAFLALLVLPVMVILTFSITYNMNLLSSFLMGILFIVLELIVVPAMLVSFLIVLACKAIKDTFVAAITGVVEGFESGLMHVLEESIFASWGKSSSLFQSLFGSDNASSNGVSGVDEPKTKRSTYFVASEPLSFDEFVPLTEEEIDFAKTLPAIKTMLEQYQDLEQRLSKVQAAIEERMSISIQHELRDVDDELIYNGLDQPVLLVKEYKLPTDNAWHVVPASTKITDKHSWSRWLEHHKTHPLTRESIANPDHYKNNITRYACYPYKKECQELYETSLSIREQLENQPRPIVKPSIGASDWISNTFFGSPIEGLNLTVLEPPEKNPGLSSTYS